MKDSFSVTVIRPYKDIIRDEMFKVLEDVGAKIKKETILSQDDNISEILDNLLETQPDVLLLPFHAIYEAEIDYTTGLKILALILETYPWADHTPVLMPVSDIDRGQFEKDLPSFLNIPFHRRKNILILDEEDIFGGFLKPLILNHLQKFDD